MSHTTPMERQSVNAALEALSGMRHMAALPVTPENFDAILSTASAIEGIFKVFADQKRFVVMDEALKAYELTAKPLLETFPAEYQEILKGLNATLRSLSNPANRPAPKVVEQPRASKLGFVLDKTNVEEARDRAVDRCIHIEDREGRATAIRSVLPEEGASKALEVAHQWLQEVNPEVANAFAKRFGR